MPNAEQEIISLLALPADNLQTLEEKLVLHINELINEDFERLVHILYRVDVDEQKLKKILHQNSGKDAAAVIARLLIDRQIEKIHHRNAFRKEDTGEENGW